MDGWMEIVPGESRRGFFYFLGRKLQTHHFVCHDHIRRCDVLIGQTARLGDLFVAATRPCRRRHPGHMVESKRAYNTVWSGQTAPNPTQSPVQLFSRFHCKAVIITMQRHHLDLVLALVFFSFRYFSAFLPRRLVSQTVASE